MKRLSIVIFFVWNITTVRGTFVNHNRKKSSLWKKHDYPKSKVSETKKISLKSQTTESNTNVILSSNDIPDTSIRPIYYGAVINVTYDGSHFYGWSAANDNLIDDDDDDDDHENPLLDDLQNKNVPRSRRSRRNRRGLSVPTPYGNKNGGKQSKRNPPIRSVQGVIQKNLAKLYGNVDATLVTVEGCSRTDKGVHARSLIATFNCLDEKVKLVNTTETENSMKAFRPIPCGGDAGKIMFCLNRMLPPDVRIMGISPLESFEFHPTLHSETKTYRYTFSVGKVYDPMRWRHVWHLEGVSAATDENKNQKPRHRVFDINAAKEVMSIFEGEHNFSAFKGAFRGSERKAGKTVNPICHIVRADITEEKEDVVDLVNYPLADYQVGGEDGGLITYTVEITGDRFLYKMVRFMVGSMVAAGLGKITTKDVANALYEKEWDETAKKYIMCAPAHGLMLRDVNYGESKKFDWITSNV